MASSGSVCHESSDEFWKALLKSDLEKEKSKKKEQRAIGTGNKELEKEYDEGMKKTGPGHEAAGAGAGGGGDGGRDGGKDGGHVYAMPKKGFIFCQICRQYIPDDEIDDHVSEEHPPMDGDD